MKHDDVLSMYLKEINKVPLLTREEEVVKQFDTKVEYILTDGTLSPLASTVLDATSPQANVLRVGSISQEELLSVFEDSDDFV